MIRSRFFICPVCGNIIHTLGEAVIHCHGVQLLPEEAEETDEEHIINRAIDKNKIDVADLTGDRIPIPTFP